jgi:general secretion pathway protein L
MPHLIVLLPAALAPELQVPWVRVDDDGSLRGEGQTELGGTELRRLAAGARLVGVAPAEVSSLLRCDLPSLPPAKLAAALRGALEERLLGEPRETALCAGAPVGGRIDLAAATRVAWLERLNGLGLPFVRVVPALGLLAPGEAWVGAGGVWLRAADGEAAFLPLDEQAPPDAAQLPPSAKLLAASLPQWLARAVRAEPDLLQGPFAPRRGIEGFGRGFSESLQAMWRAGWLRPAAWAVLALLLVQLAGLQARAWQLREQLAERRQAQHELLRRVRPDLPVILDAPLQLEREWQEQRAQAGLPPPGDIVTMLAALHAAAPPQQRLAELHYKDGELRVRWQAPGAGAALAEDLRRRGYQADEQQDGALLTLRPAPGGGGRP